jgi:hypothetical protein
MDKANHLYSMEQSGLYAIVSDVSLEEYGEDAMKDKAEDIEWLKEKAVIFMEVILKINSLCSIIPMKFLTIFTSDERVKGVITENYEKFLHNFDKIDNREELSLKIYCDDKQYKDKVMAEEIKKFEQSIIGKPKGAAFFLKKKFDGELDDKIQNRICGVANQVAEKINSLAVEVKTNKLLAKEITGISTQMILNCAYLVDNEKELQISERIEELKGDYESSGFIIELSGPWPPFSFCE